MHYLQIKGWKLVLFSSSCLAKSRDLLHFCHLSSTIIRQSQFMLPVPSGLGKKKCSKKGIEAGAGSHRLAEHIPFKKTRLGEHIHIRSCTLASGRMINTRSSHSSPLASGYDQFVMSSNESKCPHTPSLPSATTNRATSNSSAKF